MLKGKVAFITGAGSGIGKAAAVHLAKEGANVCICARREERIEETCKEINSLGADCLAVPCDVGHEEDIKTAVGHILQKWQRLDIVVANAGVNGVWAPLEKMEVKEWDDVLNINLRGAFLTLRHTVPHLKKQGGNIVLVSSIHGTRKFANPSSFAYSVTKAGEVALGRTLAVELGKFNIRVNTVCPGRIEANITKEHTLRRDVEEAQTVTTQTPEGDMPLKTGEGEKPKGIASDVANLIGFLVSEKASLISGTEVWIDGAQSLIF